MVCECGVNSARTDRSPLLVNRGQGDDCKNELQLRQEVWRMESLGSANRTEHQNQVQLF